MENRFSPSEERNADNVSRRRRRANGVQARALHSPPRHQVNHSTPPVDNRAPLQVSRPRLYARPGASHLQRHRLSRGQREDDTFGTVQDAVNRLNEVTSNLTSVLDEPLPQIQGPNEFTGLIDDMDSMNRRSKRRKLDSDPLDAQPSFSYGYHGQVAPGRLKMDISDYEGGHLMEQDELLPEKNYHPNNILRNDKSVYCSKEDRCNIILKHLGETPFTVTKIIIKAPDCGFTAPVQEGILFISMSDEDLMSLTSKFQIQDTCPHGLSHHSSERSRGQDDQRPRHHLRHRLRPPRRTRSIPSVLAPPGTTYFYPPLSGTDSPDTDSTPPPDDVYPFEHMPQSSDLAVRALGQPSPTGFRITTSCDDPSGDEEEPSSQEILIDRQQRRHRMDESSSSDDDDEPRRPHRQRNSPRRIEWVEKESKENRKPLHEVLPCVKFFIERKKHVVSMKFDPPVSGRYILVKLWSPEGQGNVDIQNISVHGFAGPRYFPAISVA